MPPRKRVLVVDDMPIWRKGTIYILHAIGFDADEAENGVAALEMYKNTTYAACLMDCQMPQMDGLTCTEQIRELEEISGTRTPIIGFTITPMIGVREACLKAGMDDYLSKSCSTQELEDTIKKWIR